jgi:hypothetical protein
VKALAPGNRRRRMVWQDLPRLERGDGTAYLGATGRGGFALRMA